MQVHHLKTWPSFYSEIASGIKTFEIRNNDRNYQVGDRLVLNEWNPETKQYTDRAVVRDITYITDWQQQSGNVVIGLKKP